MKNSGFSVFLAIVILLLLILLGWTGCSLYKANGGHLIGATDCKDTPTAADCKADLALGEPGASVWDDGTVSLAAPITNNGGGAATHVEVTAISLGGGSLSQPVTLPVALGAIAADERGVVKAQVKSLAVPASYTLSVKGTYKDAAGAHSFDLQRAIKVEKAGQGPLKAAPISVVVHHTSGTPISPAPVSPRNSGDDNDRPGRPAADGPPLKPFTVSPVHTAPAKAPAPGQTGQSISITYDTKNGSFLSFPPDPATSVANSAGMVLQTDNTVLDISKDGGNSFPIQINPSSVFTAADGGICCDQVVIYDPNTDLFFWLLQYNGTAAPASNPKGPGGPNRLRIAFAHPADLKNNPNGWSWFDLTQAQLNSQSGLDYPDLAISGKYIWISVDSSLSSSGSSGLAVTRFSLTDITNGSSTIHGATFGMNQSTDEGYAWAGRLVQNSPDGAFWAGTVDTSHMEVWRWRDADDNPSSNVTAVDSWCNNAPADYVNLAPDGLQWLDNGHAAGTGAIIAGTRQPKDMQGKLGGPGRVWFGWGAGKDASGCSQSGRPRPYVKIIQVDDNSLKSVGEYHIWNPDYAFAYPSIGADPFGNVGVMVSYGGPNDYATTTVGYLGDYVVYYTEQSDATLQAYQTDKNGNVKTDSSGNYLTFTRYGDFFTVRNSGLRNSSLSAQGYEVRLIDPTQKKCLNGPKAPFNCTMHPHYIQWGK